MNVSLAAFLHARFTRLAPTYVASTLIVAPVSHASLCETLRTALVFPLLWQPSRINGAMWSLAVEGCLYLLFPLLLLAMPRDRSVRWIALALCALGVAWIAIEAALAAA